MTKTQQNNLQKYFKWLDKKQVERLQNAKIKEALNDNWWTYNRFKEVHKVKGIRFKNESIFNKMTDKEKINYIKEHLKLYYENQFKQYKENIQNILLCDEVLHKIEINVNWSKSYTWGWNPHATASVNNKYVGDASASGCGYCKRSTVYSHSLRNSKTFKKAVLLEVLKNDITKEENRKNLPYGVRINEWGFSCDFAGCGVSTFTNILQFIGFDYMNITDSENYYIAYKNIK